MIELLHPPGGATRPVFDVRAALGQSEAWAVALQPAEDRRAALARLSNSEALALAFDWRFWARPKQLEPLGGWETWLILAGRGNGKTRTGAEWLRENLCGSTPLARGRYRAVALVAETAADARDVMAGDGKPLSDPTAGSGILQVHPKAFRPLYEPSKRRLTWPNGAIATLYNAVEPDQLRGPQHDAAWCDELAKWRYAQDTWDNLQFGLRLGQRPRCLITTTPRPIKLLKDIKAEPGTVLTTGSTYDNRANLAPSFLARLKRLYEGTRLGRQELNAELLEDVAGAMWARDTIERGRVKVPPPLRRVVVAIDPAVTSGEDADETGIVVLGLGEDGHLYVLADLSGRYAPHEWATIAIRAFREWLADRIVAERNNGGDMVEATIRMVDVNVPVTTVWASRGKAVRAEPVAAVYEQDRAHHVGAFPELEDQMCAFTADFDRRTAGYSPDRMDALVWGANELVVEPSTGGLVFGTL